MENSRVSVFFIRTVDVYGRPETNLIDENYPLNGDSNYAKTKIVQESHSSKSAKTDVSKMFSILKPLNIWSPDSRSFRKSLPIHNIYKGFLKHKNIALRDNLQSEAWLDAREVAWIVA